MEIELKELSKVESQSTTNEKKMRLSENASSMVFQLFTKNVYSNPIGTVVREITSNCFDSHIEAGVNKPVLIKKFSDKNTETTYISFIDYGVGMSPDRVENIYGVYFESTKRKDNSQIGGFGIGGKTPLAYKRSTGAGEGEYDNSFYVITNYNGMKYTYCIYEGTESPVISLLHQENTVEGNGTEIRIPVLQSDIYKFEQEMVRQLYYFENIVFDGFDNEYLNDYQIINGKSFWFRGDDYSSKIHVCLGRVAYPIDYNVLGLSSNDYNIPVAIKLEVGDINVTVSRENLDYSEATVKLLKKKLDLVKKELIDLLIEQYSNIVNLEDYFNVKTKFGHLYLGKNKSIYIGGVVKQNEIDFSNFRYNFMKMPNDKQLFKFFFNVKRYGKRERKNRYTTADIFGYDNIGKDNILYIDDSEFKRKIVKQSYLNHTYDTFFIVSPKTISKHSKYDIADLFRVQIDDIVDDNGNVLPFVQSLIDMQKEYFNIVRRECTDYNTLEVPDDFIRYRKENKAGKDITELVISAKIDDSRYNVKLSDLFKFNGVVFYGHNDDTLMLSNSESLFSLLFKNVSTVYKYSVSGQYYSSDKINHNFHCSSNKKGMAMFMQISKTNAKYMKYCKKAYHISEFNTKMLSRKEKEILNYYQSQDILERYANINWLFKKTEFELVNKTWGEVVIKTKSMYEKLIENMDTDLRYYKTIITQYFNIDDVKKSKLIQDFEKHVEDLELLNTLNSDTLDYINISSYNPLNSKIIEILKKVLIF